METIINNFLTILNIIGVILIMIPPFMFLVCFGLSFFLGIICSVFEFFILDRSKQTFTFFSRGIYDKLILILIFVFCCFAFSVWLGLVDFICSNIDTWLDKLWFVSDTVINKQ